MPDRMAKNPLLDKSGKKPLAGAGVQAFLRRFPHLEPPPQAVRKSYGKEDIEWLMPTWHFLCLAGTSMQPIEILAAQHGWSMFRCRELLTRAAEVATIREERGCKVQRVAMLNEDFSQNPTKTLVHFWPKLPRKEGLDLALHYEQRIAVLVRKNPHLVHDGINNYLHHLWRTTYFPVFHNPFRPGDAIRYTHFLNEMGFPQSMLQFVHFNPAQRSLYRKKWRLALQITWRDARQMTYRKPPFRRNSASDRWLAILPVFDAAQGQHVSEILKGFHLLMIMAAIAFGYNGSSTSASAFDAA